MMSFHRKEHGAVAVEFAILLPVLLMLLLGIVECGLAFNTQISLTQAAREGARVMAVTDDPQAARDYARAAAPSLSAAINNDAIDIVSKSLADPTGSQIINACKPGNQVSVSIEYEYQPITGFIGPVSLNGRGAMRCGG